MNSALETDPQLVNTDPYGAGWMVEIELADESEIADLLSADDYAAIVG
jgi:glycine cleavage system H protein